jgi:hypothetical protein
MKIQDWRSQLHPCKKTCESNIQLLTMLQLGTCGEGALMVNLICLQNKPNLSDFHCPICSEPLGFDVYGNIVGGC